MIKINKLYNEDCIVGMKKIDSESIDLVISDPPYFKVINQSWDYNWREEQDYIEWSKKWLEETYRILRKGGSFYLFGYFRTLSKLIPILENLGFKIRQQIILNKGMQAVSGRATKKYKMFPNVTEIILFIYKDSKPFVKEFLKSKQKELGYTSKYINECLGVKSNGGGMWSIYTGNNVCKQLPTEESWNKLQKILNFNIPYCKISQTFNQQMGITDVWDDIKFYGEKNRFHPTQKPLKLIERLVLASSNEKDIILDPFMGSGTTARACIRTKRKYIGFEIEKEYYDKSILLIDKEKGDK